MTTTTKQSCLENVNLDFTCVIEFKPAYVETVPTREMFFLTFDTGHLPASQDQRPDTLKEIDRVVVFHCIWPSPTSLFEVKERL